MGQKTLGGGCEHVGEMEVSWGVSSWTIIGADKMERGKCFTCALSKGLEKCIVGTLHSHERLEVGKWN
jgi:hypothetical protein